MDAKMRKNRLALLSFLLAVLTLLPFVFAIVGGMLGLYPSPQGHYSPLYNPAFFQVVYIGIFALAILGPGAFITGIMALKRIRKYEDTEKGKRLAWIGILVGAPCSVLLAAGIIFRLTGSVHNQESEKQRLLSEMRRLAEQNVARAQYHLGQMYFYGNGVAKDHAEAAKWYRKAAEQGQVLAQHNLGVLYALGEGVPKDLEEAANWYRKAAEQGDAGSQNNLGVMYNTGQGVAQDYLEAVKWFRKAAVQGLANAQDNLSSMYATGHGVPKDMREAVRWFRMAAERGDASAQYKLGSAYLQGEGVPQDYGEAARWFRMAAEQGDVDAQFSLGVSYWKGRGVSQDFALAHMWFTLAAATGDKDAQEARDSLAKAMSAEQLQKAGELARQMCVDMPRACNR